MKRMLFLKTSYYDKIVLLILLTLIFSISHVSAGLMMKRVSSAEGMSLDIKFDYNSDRIRVESYSSLDDIAKDMQSVQWQAIKFVIEGHTDERGAAEYNKLLSQKRAQSVKRYLVEKHGINPDRLLTQGFGEERPLNKAHNAKAWAQNRRVKLKAAGKLKFKSQGNLNIILFVNTSSLNIEMRKKLSRLTSNLVSLQKNFLNLRLVSVLTDEDCTRNEILKKLKKDKGEINIVILVGNIIYNTSNEAHFETIDTDLDILEDSAISISAIQEKVKGEQESIIVVTNHIVDLIEDRAIIRKKR